MTPRLTLHQHPFASFCQKAIVAFHERGVPFEAVDVNDQADRDRLAELWPIAKMPVLVDGDSGLVVPESSTVIEYVDRLADGGAVLIPADPAEALQARLWDRTLDAYVELPMQKIVADSLRDEADRDPFGVAEARALLDHAYAALERQLAGREWLATGAFSLADCGAGPALFYARAVHPWDEAALPELTGYYGRLMHRPSVQRVVDDARFFREYFPLPWPEDVDAHQPPAAS